MESFAGKIAVVTGGGTGMGRELTRQLGAAGCHVAICDVSEAAMAETIALAAQDAPAGTRFTSFVADVGVEPQILAFRDHIVTEFECTHINLLFNNAGIGGGGSLFLDSREEWERVFNVCWGGVYFGTRAFLPLLVAANEARLVNTSSVNGFWACLGPTGMHTAYSAAKFAVKGFTEALIVDLRVNAPHVGVSVVMPGHIGTSIVFNSGAAFGRNPKELSEQQIEEMRTRIEAMGMDVSGASDEDLRALAVLRAESFRDNAPTSASEAADVILTGVRNKQWRILIGTDAHILDETVRANPEAAYDEDFMEQLRAKGAFGFIR